MFIELLVTDESKSQRHAFFAEREATKVLDMPADTKSREVKRAAVIGGGTMGGGIAMCFANAGIPVTLIETTDEFLKNGLAKIRTNYENTAKRGGMSKEDHQRFQRMAQDNMAEVEAGKLAQQKASSEEVKEFAKHMVEDHGKQLEEMKQMAEKKGASLPRSAVRVHATSLLRTKKQNRCSWDC